MVIWAVGVTTGVGSMDQDMLKAATTLRDKAYAVFKGFDDAVVSLGGKSRVGMYIAAASGSAAGVGTAKAVGETRRLTQTGAAEVILRERGEPTTGAELMAALPSKGVTIGGKNPVVNFTSAMSKSGKFDSYRKNGGYYWWFKQERPPAEWFEASDLPFDKRPDASSVHSNQEGGEAHATAT